MKKALTKLLLLALTVVTLAAIIPLSANASTSNEQKIYSYLTKEMGLNSAAACGILANIERESDFNPKLVIRDSNGRQSGGLCQWNGGRFSNLKKHCEKYGYSYLSIEGQMSYLKHELSQSAYNYIYKYLKDVSNNPDGAYKAGYYWCYYFEIPSNRGTKAKQRGSMAEDSYWPLFGNKTPAKPTLAFKEKKTTYDMDNKIYLKWSTGGKNCSKYKLYIAKKNTSTGKYDWDNCKTYDNIAASKLSGYLPKNSLKPGNYAIKLRAVNNTTGEYKDSSVIYCKIVCETHSYTSKITKQPTLTSKGTKLYTCKQCGYQTKKSVNPITLTEFRNQKMTPVKVSATSTTAIKLGWDRYEGADGYAVYQKIQGKWTLIAMVRSGSTLTYTVKKLSPTTKYSFRVRAFVTQNGKDYGTKYSDTLTASTQTATPTISVARGTKSATVSWKKISGAEGYEVYMATGEKSTSYKKVATVSSGTTSYTVKNLVKDQYYNFKVRTFIKSSDGSYVYSAASNMKYIIAR